MNIVEVIRKKLTKAKREREWSAWVKERNAQEDWDREEANRIMTEAEGYGFEPHVHHGLYVILSAEVGENDDGTWSLSAFTRLTPEFVEAWKGLDLKSILSGMGERLEAPEEVAYWQSYNVRRDAAIERGRMLKGKKDAGEPTAIMEGWL